MDKLFIIVPAYNESLNIKKFISDWYPVIERCNGNGHSRLVIINDGSTDDTYKIIKDYAKDKPLLKPLTKQNGGHGSTLLFGYRYAIKHNADFIFQTDSDGQTDSAEFQEFWKLRHEYDAVIGNRPARQDGLYRKFVQKVLLTILRITFGVDIPDSNAPFRLMKTGIVEKYIKKMPEDFNLPHVMLTTYFSYFHEKIKFVDISFKPRQGGKNSINIKRIVKIGWQALGDFKELRKHIDG